MKQNRPRLSLGDAAQIAKTLYGVSGSVHSLPSERDQNFLVNDAAGQAFVLKIASAAEDKALLELQNKVMKHLNQYHAPGLYSQPVPTKAGAEIARIEGAQGLGHYVRLLTYLSGVPLAKVNPQTPALLRNLGQFLGQMDRVLMDVSSPVAHRNLKWDLKNAGQVVSQYLPDVIDPERQALVQHCLARFERHVEPVLPHLRSSMIHNDSNDYNLLVSDNGFEYQISGIIDFGDLIDTYTICELAIAAAYVMLNKADPIFAVTLLIKGYHSALPLTEPELAVLFDLICIRLCLSVTISAHQQQLEPENQYLSVSETPAWNLLEHLSDIDPHFAHYTFRQACRLSPCPQSANVVAWLKNHQDLIGPVVEPRLAAAPNIVFDLSLGSPVLAAGHSNSAAKTLGELLAEQMRTAGAVVGIGRYNEARRLDLVSVDTCEEEALQERPTIHLGIDLFVPAGTPVVAPLDGVVHSLSKKSPPECGAPAVVIKHSIEHMTFFTLYRHLSEESVARLFEGMPVRKGEQLGEVAQALANETLPSHLHFQIICDLFSDNGAVPALAPNSQRATWLSVCPDPNLVLGIPEDCFPLLPKSRSEILKARQLYLGKSLRVSYKKPLKIVRGWRQYLFDETGRAYLDAVNNVPHVGHCHPHVVKAAQQQLALLNTNTRYLHDYLVDYAERLCATMPEPLGVCFFVCSGSEANDLALRMARIYTGHTDIVTIDGAYHGSLSSLVEISPYKFDGPGGSGAPSHVHKVVMPDQYRGPYKSGEPEAGEKYARHVREAVTEAQQRGGNVAAFFCESLLGCGGQVVLPEGYLRAAYRYVREAGGVCVADEVQVGFGRVGTHFWGFETQQVVPDIVTLGKPIGNGHPLAAVVTTPEIAEAFANGMEYFNTFGGNPVSCAVGMAVLDVIEGERLQQNAREVGNRLKAGLERLKQKHRLIGDVRGLGLFVGVELVLNHRTLAPAAAQAGYIAERMKERGILISTDGPLHNVLKIKPPLIFSQANADLFVETLDEILKEDFFRRLD